MGAQFLAWEGPLEKETAPHSSTIAWKVPWTEEPGGLQFMGSQRVRHDWACASFTEPKFCCYFYPLMLILKVICMVIIREGQWVRINELSVKKSRGCIFLRLIPCWLFMLLSHKKEQNSAICRRVDGPRDCHLSEVSLKGKNKYRVISLWNLE